MGWDGRTPYLMIFVDFSGVAMQFPGVPLETLKKRYSRMKAKTKDWTEYAVCLAFYGADNLGYDVAGTCGGV
jgi:hypothetical protein